MTEFKRQKKKVIQDLNISKPLDFYLEWIWPFCTFFFLIRLQNKTDELDSVVTEYWNPFSYILQDSFETDIVETCSLDFTTKK